MTERLSLHFKIIWKYKVSVPSRMEVRVPKP